MRTTRFGFVALAMKSALPDGFVRSDGKDGVGHRRCSRRGGAESTAPTRLEHSAQCNRSVVSAGAGILKDFVTPCPAQRVELQGKVLFVRRNPSVADHHGRNPPCPDFE